MFGPPALPFQDVLDSMWGMLRARYAELGSPCVTESQQDALLRGLEELVTIGKEKLARDHLAQTTSRGALQAQIQNHKVRHAGQSAISQTRVFWVGTTCIHFLPWGNRYRSFVLLASSHWKARCVPGALLTSKNMVWKKQMQLLAFVELSIDWEDNLLRSHADRFKIKIGICALRAFNRGNLTQEIRQGFLGTEI